MYLMNNEHITANIGTPNIIPTNPNNPPNINIENSTQKLLIPVLLPISLGPSMLPSNCCMRKMSSKNFIHNDGSIIRSKNAHGIAPMNGPKYGIMLVIPTIIEIIRAYGI